MIRRGGERAVSVQIGAVLVLAILVLALSMYQVNAVPEENKGVEIDHHQEVRTQLTELRNGIVDAPHRGSAGSHTVSLGTGYPSRSFLVNPPPATGTIRTVETNDESYAIEIVNATPADSDANDAWNVSGQPYETGAIEYRPHYHEYRDAPAVVYENSVLFNEQGDGRVTLTDQAIIDGNRITLVMVDGNYSRTGSHAAAVDVSTLSASENVLDLTDADERGNITLRVPTKLSVDEWERLIHDEDVTVESGGPNVVELVLDPGTYELRMAKVGFGSGVNGEDESYLTVVDGPENVSEGESTEMTLEVRDRFNNPVSNAQVNATDDGDGTLTPDNDTTGSAGRVTFTYTAGDDEGGSAVHLDTSFRVDPNVSPINTSQPENVSRTIRIASSSDSGSGGGGSDGAAFIISNFQSPSSAEQGDTIIVNATVTNTGSVKGTQTVEYTFDGTVENSSSVTLDPGTSTTVEFVHTIPKSIPTGDYSQAIDSADDSESVNIAVTSAPESPSIDQFAVSDDSNNNHAKYNVNWEVFDSESDIVEVSVELVGSTNGIVYDRLRDSYEGVGSATGEPLLENKHESQQDYIIRITATDSAGYTARQEVEDYADGSDP